MAIVLAYRIREFINMYTYANPEVKESTVKISLKDPENRYAFAPSFSNFNIAIGFKKGLYNRKIPPKSETSRIK